MQFLDKMKTKMNQGYGLKYTTLVKDFNNNDIQLILESLYNGGTQDLIKIGSLLNAVFTKQVRSFPLSQHHLCTILRNDFNNKCNTTNTDITNRIINYLLTTEVIALRKEAEKKKAPIYCIIDDDILSILYKLHDKKYYDDYDRNLIAWQEGSDKFLLEQMI